MTTKEKATRELGGVGVASKLHSGLNSISTSAWVLEYSLEEARQSHEAHGRHFRRLACCAGLALLQLMGGPHHV